MGSQPGQNPANGCAADSETAGYLGFADAGTVEFSDLTGLLSDGNGPTEMLSLQPGFGDACTNPLAKNLVFELGEYRKQPCHGATRRRRQIERFSERTSPRLLIGLATSLLW